MAIIATFKMGIRVWDAERLLKAALAHPDAMSHTAYVDEEGNIDIGVCLVTLLDPSVIEGAEILQSEVVVVEEEA